MRLAGVLITLVFLALASSHAVAEKPLEPTLLEDAAAGNAPVGHVVTLGPAAVDPEGLRGRIHRVVAGDTLWEISKAYLGTAWVWPSVWQENGSIENPHLIRPGDRIWISKNRMRIVTRAEAEAWTTGEVTAIAPGPIRSAQPHPADSAARDAEVVVQQPDRIGFLSNRALAGASSIVDSPELRTWLAERDRVYVGLGEGAVEVGDQFLIFREPEAVRGLQSSKPIGYHVNVLGWLEVSEVRESSAVAFIRESYSEIQRGNRITPRGVPPKRVSFQEAPEGGVTGHVVFIPGKRSVMGTRDTVYIDRGTKQGLASGMVLEVFETGRVQTDAVRSASVRTPDHVVADLVVISTQPDSAVALVTHTTRELEVGNSFRTRALPNKIAGL